MKTFQIAIVALSFLFVAPPPAGSDEQGMRTIEDFQAIPVGELPDKGWRSRHGDPKQVYRVEAEEKEHFLAARDAGQSIQFFREVDWDLAVRPLLSWRWRVHEFPVGSDEREDTKNDSAAGVYVIFPRKLFIPQSIKYVWSETLPAPTVLKKSKWHAIIVMRSGKEGVGKWHTETRNIAADYEMLFDRKPPKPVAIGFLTDANAVKGKASADYDQIQVSTSK